MFSHALHTRTALFGKSSYPNSTSRLSRSLQVSIRAEAMDGLKQTANGVGHAIQKGIQKAGEATSGQGDPKKNIMPSIKFNTDGLTTNTGTPVANNMYSLRAGNRGPVLLEDYHLLEKLGQFHREKIPERVVHARGAGAKGYFEVTNDLTHLTAAAFMSSVGKRTNVAARLSTVVHPAGSPESLRDVRGFSVKFYTEEGNWDFVGNDIPVFFIRDGMQFPDLVHSLQPNPKTNIQEGWRILDFLSHHPESCNILTWLLDDNGIPANWRRMEGYAVNTFKLINSEGVANYCKFHVMPKEGAAFLTDEEAQMAGEKNMRHSHATHDLYNAIAEGDYPEWTFFVQVMPMDTDPATLGFDPLDDTKVWPEDKFPLIEMGKMVLNENPNNYFSEVECIAFSPGVTVPGIGISNDPVLQTRVMSYSDTQRYRLGGNYQLLPINMPQCPFHNNHKDGVMNYTVHTEEVNYWPSKVENVAEEQQPKYARTQYSHESVHGERVQEDLFVGDDYVQAGDRIRSMDPARKDRFLEHVTGWLVEPKMTNEVRDAWLDIWDKCDGSFGGMVRSEVEKAAPSGKREMATSKA